MGRLTTHVLDTARGCPAAGLLIELFDEAGRKLAEGITNADGRLDRPIAEGEALKAGIHELVFHVGAYFAKRGENSTSPAFLDRVPVRFGIGDPSQHYHVPLLVAPFAYSTYRGS